MAVAIPTFPQGTSTNITLRSSSVDLKPTFGGPTQRLSRLADKWLYDVQLRPMNSTQAGPYLAALAQGLSQTVVATVLQGQNLSAFNNTGTVVSNVTSGSILNIQNIGSTPFVGQFFSIIHGGVRYLHMITAIAGSQLTVIPALKTSITAGDVLEFAAPKIEGFIEGNEQSWTVGMVSNVGVSFKIVEAN